MDVARFVANIAFAIAGRVDFIITVLAPFTHLALTLRLNRIRFTLCIGCRAMVLFSFRLICNEIEIFCWRGNFLVASCTAFSSVNLLTSSSVIQSNALPLKFVTSLSRIALFNFSPNSKFIAARRTRTRHSTADSLIYCWSRKIPFVP